MIMRLIIELEELTIRRTKLDRFLSNNPDCPKTYLELCSKQMCLFEEYRKILIERIRILIEEKEPTN